VASAGIEAKSTRAVRRGLHCRPAFILAAVLHDLAHYVRSGKFVLALIRDAQAVAF
jgi:predicted HD phosphohydrolase